MYAQAIVTSAVAAEGARSRGGAFRGVCEDSRQSLSKQPPRGRITPPRPPATTASSAGFVVIVKGLE